MAYPDRSYGPLLPIRLYRVQLELHVVVEFAGYRVLAISWTPMPIYTTDHEQPVRHGVSSYLDDMVGQVPVSYTHLTLPTKRIV